MPRIFVLAITFLLGIGLSLKDCSAQQNPLIIRDAVAKIAKQARLTFELGGMLKTVHVKPGQEVKRDQPLLSLDSQFAQLDLTRTQLDVQNARRQSLDQTDLEYALKSFAVAQNEYRRAVASEEKFPQSTSKSELERLKLMMDLADLSVTQARQSLELKQIALKQAENEQAKAQQTLNRHDLLSPLTGIVSSIRAQPGETIAPHQPVITVIDLTELHVEVFVQHQERATLKVGMNVEFTPQISGSESPTAQGKLIFLSPAVDTITGECLIRAEIQNPDQQLLSGSHGLLKIMRD